MTGRPRSRGPVPPSRDRPAPASARGEVATLAARAVLADPRGTVVLCDADLGPPPPARPLAAALDRGGRPCTWPSSSTETGVIRPRGRRCAEGHRRRTGGLRPGHLCPASARCAPSIFRPFSRSPRLRHGGRHDRRRHRAGMRWSRCRSRSCIAPPVETPPVRPPRTPLATSYGSRAAPRPLAFRPRDPRDRPGNDRHDLPVSTSVLRCGSRRSRAPAHYPGRLGRARRGRDLDNVQATAHAALEDAGTDPGSLEAIGITNQRETALAWDRDSGEPLARALVWQDRAPPSAATSCATQGHEQTSRERTGSCSTRTSAVRMGVAADRRRRRPTASGPWTMDSWRVHKLCGLHATDHSNASRVRWSSTSIAELRSRAVRAAVDPPGGAADPLRAPTSTARPTSSVRWLGRRGRHRRRPQAALFGQGCHSPGERQEHLRDRLVRPPEHRLQATSARPRPALDAGLDDRRGAHRLRGRGEHLRDGRGPCMAARRTRDHRGGGRDGALAASLESNDGVYSSGAHRPASPHWDPYARGTIVG